MFIIFVSHRTHPVRAIIIGLLLNNCSACIRQPYTGDRSWKSQAQRMSDIKSMRGLDARTNHLTQSTIEWVGVFTRQSPQENLPLVVARRMFRWVVPKSWVFETGHKWKKALGINCPRSWSCLPFTFSIAFMECYINRSLRDTDIMRATLVR